MRTDRGSELTTPAAYRQEFQAANFYCMQFTIRDPDWLVTQRYDSQVTPPDDSPFTPRNTCRCRGGACPARRTKHSKRTMRITFDFQLERTSRPATHRPDVP